MYILHHLPWFWLGVLVLCLLVESFTLALTTVWFACGALVMIFVALLPLPFRWQLLLFLAISCALLLFTRPLVLRHFKLPKAAMNSDALVGRTVSVTADIGTLQKGTVTVNGVVWAAESADDAAIPRGTRCVITAIQGATLVVAVENQAKE